VATNELPWICLALGHFWRLLPNLLLFSTTKWGSEEQQLGGKRGGGGSISRSLRLRAMPAMHENQFVASSSSSCWPTALQWRAFCLAFQLSFGFETKKSKKSPATLRFSACWSSQFESLSSCPRFRKLKTQRSSKKSKHVLLPHIENGNLNPATESKTNLLN